MRYYHYNSQTKEYMGYIDTEYKDISVVGHTLVKPPTEYVDNDFTYVWDGNTWNKVLRSIDKYKNDKIHELKTQWYSKETEPVEYNDNKYDYDEKSQTRIMSAITALTVEGKSAYLMWTTADNENVKVKASDLKAIVSLGAKRSDTLHGLYNKYKEQIQSVETLVELEELTFDWKEE